MASYDLQVEASVHREMRGIPRADAMRILARLEALRVDPRPPGSERLSGREGYRVRQGNFRIVYLIDDAARIVRIVRIGHRREVYRRR